MNRETLASLPSQICRAGSTLDCTNLMEHTVPGVPNISFGIVDARDVAAAQLAAMEKPEAAGNSTSCPQTHCHSQKLLRLSGRVSSKKRPTSNLLEGCLQLTGHVLTSYPGLPFLASVPVPGSLVNNGRSEPGSKAIHADTLIMISACIHTHSRCRFTYLNCKSGWYKDPGGRLICYYSQRSGQRLWSRE